MFYLYRFYKLKFLYPFLVGLVFTMVWIGYCVQALSDFYAYQGGADRNIPLTAETFRFFLKNTLNRELIRIRALQVKTQSPLPTFYITADKTDFDKLNAHLPSSGKKQYITAFMKTSDSPEVKRVKLRYRGGNNSHWLYPQKSLRIKMRKRDTYNMEKKFNLVNPPHSFTLPIETVDYGLARKIGLIAPDYYPIRVFINGKYMGVYSYLSQVDESLIRKHKRMPGSIYQGEGAPIDENGISLLWRDEKYWQKIAARSSEEENNRQDIAYLIQAVNHFDALQFYEFVNQTLHKERFYKFFAMDVIFGCGHHDYHHNHKLYFDPYKGMFEPILWNMGNWFYKYATGKKDFSYYPLLHRIKLNPVLEAERDAAAFQMMKRFDYKWLKRAFDKTENVILDDLKADAFRDYRVFPGGTFKKWVSKSFDIRFYKRMNRLKKATLEQRRSSLKELYRDARGYYCLEPLQKDKQEKFRFLVKINGNSGINVRLKEWLRETVGHDVFLYQDTNLNGKLDDEDRLIVNDPQKLYPGRKSVEMKNSFGSFFKILFGDKKTVNAPLYYSFIVKGRIPVNGRSIKAENMITGDTVEVKYRKFTVGDEADSIHPWRLPVYRERREELSGKVEVKETLVFDRFTTVYIFPGTTFIIAPGKSIFFYGPVHAQGTRERPIRFRGGEAGKPWGVVAVQGEKASGSTFDFCEFEDGAVDTRRLIHYTAPLSIHDLSGFRISHCSFGRNHTGDDNLHIAYASGVVQNCIFSDSLSDAVDVDIAEVTVSNCVFINSGNDGLDFMTSRATARNNLFIGSGDKGISVGEWSMVDLSGNIYYRCRIAVEVKDKSRVSMDRSLVMDCGEKLLNLYRKNNHYDIGGTLTAGEIYVPGGLTDVTADKLSQFIIRNMENRFPDFGTFLFPRGIFKNAGNWLDFKTQLNRLSANPNPHE